MRVLFLSSVYDSYWRSLWRARAFGWDSTWREQYDALRTDFFSFYGSYPYYLSQLGYECAEVFFNVEPLQRAWAREQGIPFDPETYRQELPLEVVRQFRPDIVFIVGAEHGSNWIGRVRDAIGSHVKFVRWCGTRVQVSSLRSFDLVLTSARTYERMYRELSVNVRHLPFAFDPRVLDGLDTRGVRDVALSFVGSLNLTDGFHRGRMRIIAELLEEGILSTYVLVRPLSTKYKAYLRVNRLGWKAMRLVMVPATVVSSLPVIGRHLEAGGAIDVAMLERILEGNRGARFGMEMYRTLARSRATLNTHLDEVGDSIGNIRMFEATGVGACMLTDWKSDLGDYFDIDDEVVAYRSTAEAIDKGRWLAANPIDCERIGLAAQKRVLRCHSYATRAASLDGYFRELVKT